MSSEILDISVSRRRADGERRKGINLNRPRPKEIEIVVWNPFRTLMNHRKHEGLIYRDALGGEEKRGKPRFHGDWFD